MKSSYDDTTKVIQDMAAVKRTMNSHKGRIEDIDKKHLLKLLSQEIDELREADTMINTIEEAADAYNFILAIVHREINEYRSRNDANT